MPKLNPRYGPRPGQPYTTLPRPTLLPPGDSGVSSIRVPVQAVGLRMVPTTDVHPPARRSLTAASRRLDLKENGSYRRLQGATWQQEAWALADQVGELRYAANLYANGLSRMKLSLIRRTPEGQVVKLSDLKAEELTEADRTAQKIMRDLATDQAMAEMQRLWGLNKFVVGEALLVGVPDGRSTKKLLDYCWKLYSRDDVQEKNGLILVCGQEYTEDQIIVIRVWQPHPRFSREADSPVRASLPVLRELVGLTMHVSALIDSRLAGAGILLLPTSATVLGATAPEDDDEEDPTVAALIESMVTPIKDRDSAASVVPLVLTVPDESADLVRHITFSSPLEQAAKDLRDEAIRRLALGVDMPPEQLLGLGNASHWSAWLLAEDTVKYQFIPGMKPFADAIVLELLRPIMEELGVTQDEAETYDFLVDSDDLISRPNKFDEAMELYKVDAITLSAVLQAGGFALTDAPVPKEDVDRAVDLAIKAVSINPSLFDSPGLPNLVSQLRAVLSGQDASNAPPDALPPALQNTDGPGVGDAPTGPPATSKDKKTNEPGPAVTRPRDSNK